MKHPFECISIRRRKTIYWISLGGTFLVAIALGALAREFVGKTDPSGRSYDIIAFEFAHTPDVAQRITETWGPDGVSAAWRQILLDYLFLLLYPNAIALGILAVTTGSQAAGMVASVGRFLAWGQWLAGLLDAVENAMLLRILAGHAGSPAPEIAFYCASVKFVFVGCGILFILGCLPLVWKTEEAELRSA